MDTSPCGGSGPEQSLRAEAAVAASITRRQLCGAMAGGAMLVSMHGCGGGGDTPDAPGSGCGSSGAAISLNHGHSLAIASGDLDSLVDITYGSRGSSDHDHTVILSVAQLRQLKAGASVTVMASVFAAHTHVVTVACTP